MKRSRRGSCIIFRGLAKAGVTALSALAIIMAFNASACAADNPSGQGLLNKEKKLEDVKKRIREEKKNIKTIERKESSILGDLEDINRIIVKRTEELSRFNRKLTTLRSEMAEAGGRIKKLERERVNYARKLEARISAMYKLKRGEAVGLLFSSGSSAELARRHKYLTIIMENDSILIGELEKNISELEAERARLKGLTSDLEQARKDVSRKRSEAQAQKGKKRVLLAKVKREKKKTEGMLIELEEAAKELTKLLKNFEDSDDIDISGGGFATLMGRLKMPVSGKIVSSYGRIRHPKFNTVTFNNGIVIDAPADTPVKSVHDGKVVYTGWLKGYGQIMIIDHGGGYFTLFAYLSKILKDRGEMVTKGMEIALVGDTGPRSNPGLYFEIRKHGVPKDPVPWFAKR